MDRRGRAASTPSPMWQRPSWARTSRSRSRRRCAAWSCGSASSTARDARSTEEDRRLARCASHRDRARPTPSSLDPRRRRRHRGRRRARRADGHLQRRRRPPAAAAPSTRLRWRPRSGFVVCTWRRPRRCGGSGGAGLAGSRRRSGSRTARSYRDRVAATVDRRRCRLGRTERLARGGHTVNDASDGSDMSAQTRLLLRVGLAYLAVSGALVGVWAASRHGRSTTTSRRLGRVWVAVDGPYNEHLVRDVGSLNLALAVADDVALVTLARTLVMAAARGLARHEPAPPGVPRGQPRRAGHVRPDRGARQPGAGAARSCWPAGGGGAHPTVDGLTEQRFGVVAPHGARDHARTEELARSGGRRWAGGRGSPSCGGR